MIYDILSNDMTEHSVASIRNGFTVQGGRRRDGFLCNVKRRKATFLLKDEFQNTKFRSLPIYLDKY